MRVTVHQSICGEVDKAWGLIKTTMPDNAIAKNIAFRTDLQDQTTGTIWKPAIRGFTEGEYYLIMRTFEDISSHVRRGRKFSHVLIIKKRDLIKVDNISELIALLPTEIDKTRSIDVISLELSHIDSPDIPKGIEGKMRKLINGYVNISTHRNTLLWIGQEDFESALISLWKRLTINERENFQFGIAFNNDQKDTTDLRLIAVPESIQSKFVKSGMFVVGQSDTHEPIDLLEQLIFGDEAVQQRIANFERIIESKPLSRNDIALIAKGIDTFEQIHAVKDIKRLNTLSHIVAQYAPSEKQGVHFKELLLATITKLSESAVFTDISVLRNFKTEAFKNSKSDLTNCLKKWIKSYIFLKQAISVNNLPFFGRIQVDNPGWWDTVINQEIQDYLGHIDKPKLKNIFIWIELSDSIFDNISLYLDKSHHAEELFIEMLPPSPSKALSQQLKAFSISNRWVKLLAVLLKRSLPFEIALAELMLIDTDPNSIGAIEILVDQQNDASIIDYAITSGEPRMIKIAGIICHKSPKNLMRIDLVNYNWQLIWLLAIENGNQLETGLKNAKKVIYELLDCIIAGIEVHDELLNIIAKSDFGNLLLYPQRVILWNHLPSYSRNFFLIKTSAALLEQLSLNSTTEIPDDPVLADHISGKGIADFLYFNRDNIKSIIPVFERFQDLTDYNLQDYLRNFSGQLNPIDATHLGKLVAGRHFSSCAHIINLKATKSNSWRFALAESYFLLDFWAKIALSISGVLAETDISDIEWWESTESLIIELYPNGTSLTTVWKKAGGKESDLLIKGTASEIWADVFHKFKIEAFKGISMNDLLKEVKKQYGDNKKFQMIYDLRKSFLKT